MIISATLSELDRGEKLFAKRISILRARREASNYVPQYFVSTRLGGTESETASGAIDPEIKAQKSLAKAMSDQEIIVGLLPPSSYEKSELEVDCDRRVFRIVRSASKAAMSRLNSALPKARNDWVYAGAFSPILWPQKVVCAELKFPDPDGFPPAVQRISLAPEPAKCGSWGQVKLCSKT